MELKCAVLLHKKPLNLNLYFFTITMLLLIKIGYAPKSPRKMYSPRRLPSLHLVLCTLAHWHPLWNPSFRMPASREAPVEAKEGSSLCPDLKESDDDT